MLPKRGLIAVASLALLVGPGRGQETAQTVVARAIQAHGGMERLSRAQADRARIKGILFLNGKEVPFTGETLIQLPNKMKHVFQLQIDGRTHSLVQVFNGERASVTLNGQPQKPEAAAINEMREAMAVARVARLAPLLSDRSFQLSLLPETKVNDRPALGVKAEAKGQKPINLYFDKQTGFLVKSEHELDDGMGKAVNQEIFYSDFRDLAGFKRPIKMTYLRKGAKVMEAEMVEVRYFDRIDDAEFARP